MRAKNGEGKRRNAQRRPTAVPKVAQALLDQLTNVWSEPCNNSTVNEPPESDPLTLLNNQTFVVEQVVTISKESKKGSILINYAKANQSVLRKANREKMLKLTEQIARMNVHWNFYSAPSFRVPSLCNRQFGRKTIVSKRPSVKLSLPRSIRKTTEEEDISSSRVESNFPAFSAASSTTRGCENSLPHPTLHEPVAGSESQEMIF